MATNHAFTTEQRICIALKFYATGSFQHEIGDGEGASQSRIELWPEYPEYLHPMLMT